MPYAFVGAHAESLESGRQLLFGDVVSDADGRLLDEGKLIPVETTPSTPSPALAVTKETA